MHTLSRPRVPHQAGFRCLRSASSSNSAWRSRAALVRFQASSAPVQVGLTFNLQIQEFDGRQYVQLGEVEKLVQDARDDLNRSFLVTQEQLQEEVQSATEQLDEVKQELTKKERLLFQMTEGLEEAKAQVACLTKELELAVLTAAEQLEARFEATYQQAHRSQLNALQGRLDTALSVASDAEARALSAAVRTEEALVRHGQEAAAAVHTEAQAALQLAKVSTEKAHAAAQQSAAAAQHALQQQQESLEMVKTIQAKALAAEQRADSAHREALALQGEVATLREQLKEAHKKAAEAEQRAVTADKAAADKMTKLEEESAKRLASLDAAYEALKKAERDSATAARTEVEYLTKRNQELAGEISAMREAAATMQSEVAQARSQAEATTSTLSQSQQILQANLEAQMDTGLKNLEVLKRACVAEARQQVLGEVETAVVEAKALMARMQSEIQSQSLAQQRALEATTQERNFWRQRYLQAEEDLRAMQLESERVEKEMLQRASSNGTASFPPLPPTRRVIGQAQLWKLMADGPRIERLPPPSPEEPYLNGNAPQS